jgi:hypothetical protein
LAPFVRIFKVLEEEEHAKAEPNAVFDGLSPEEFAAQFFGGVGIRLIDYDPELFPIIEASPLHFFVDPGDLRTSGNLGQRNAIAVRRSRNKECLIIFAGAFLNDRSRTLGGMIPGIEDNLALAENLIDLLSSKARNKSDHISTAYELLRELEATLGKFIRNVLASCSVDGNFSELIPENIRVKLMTKDGVMDYSLATYIQLVGILKDQWSQFERHFAAAAGRSVKREEVTKPLFEINTGQRIYLAHPHKAIERNIKFGPQDVAAIRDALFLIRRASTASAT